MTITRMAATAMMAATVAGMAAAAGQSVQPQPKVTVYLLDNANVSNVVRLQAEEMASRMLARAGVSLDWSRKMTARNSAEPMIILELATDTPQDYKPGALAYAMPYEGVHIKVFFDRIASRQTPFTVLAHVMVHEITHILQGVSLHADTGVMKAHWTAVDFREMRYKPLAFTADDIDLIHVGLSARSARRETLLAMR